MIKTDEEHQQALDRLMALMDMEPEPKTPEWEALVDELEALAVQIENYERENFPMD